MNQPHELRSADGGETLQLFHDTLVAYLWECPVPDDEMDWNASSATLAQVLRGLGAQGYLEVGTTDDPAEGDALGRAGETLLVRESARVWGSLGLTLIPQLLAQRMLATAVFVDADRPLHSEIASGSLRVGMPLNWDVPLQPSGIGSAQPEDDGEWVSGLAPYMVVAQEAATYLIPLRASVGTTERTAHPSPRWAIVQANEGDGRVRSVRRLESCRSVSVGDVELDRCRVLTIRERGYPDDLHLLSAAFAIGLARGALDIAITYGMQRVQFQQPIATFGKISSMIVISDAKIAAAEAYVASTARKLDTGRGRRGDSRRATLLCRRIAVEVTRLAQHIHGGYGHMSEFHVGRFVRDSHLAMFLGSSPGSDLSTIREELGLVAAE